MWPLRAAQTSLETGVFTGKPLLFNLEEIIKQCQILFISMRRKSSVTTRGLWYLQMNGGGSVSVTLLILSSLRSFWGWDLVLRDPCRSSVFIARACNCGYQEVFVRIFKPNHLSWLTSARATPPAFKWVPISDFSKSTKTGQILK